MSSSPENPEARPTVPGWIDTHAHLNDERLQGQLPRILDEARTAGVAQVLCIGTTARDSAEALEIAVGTAGSSPRLGFSPTMSRRRSRATGSRSSSMRPTRTVHAIGETGLDRYWDHTPFPRQQVLFDRHLDDSPASADCRSSSIAAIASGTSSTNSAESAALSKGCCTPLPEPGTMPRHSSISGCISRSQAW